MAGKVNRLIAALPDEAYHQWAAQLQAVDMRLGDVLHEPGGTVGHVYFPTTSTVSMLHVLESGASAEIAVVGNEGIVGIPAFMGGESTPNQLVVRSAGRGLRLPAAAAVNAFKQGGPVSRLLLRYTQALMTQITLTAACNRHHSVEQQLCRLLLFSRTASTLWISG